MRNNRYVSTVTVVICSAISIWALTKSSVSGFFQDQDRVILQAKPHENDPIEITEIKVKDKRVNFGENFAEDDKWLKQATFKIKNKYSKPITYIQINIDFPETASTGVMMQHQFFLGRHPVFDKPTTNTSLQIMPGESLEVSLASEYNEIKKMIERRNSPINNIRKTLIRLSEVGFEDGTIYSGDNIFRRNPDPNGNPKWLKVIE